MNTVPPTIIPARPRVGRKRTRGASPPTPPPPVALTLVAASYDSDTSVTLVFDRAVNIAGLDASQLQIDDHDGTGFRYLGTGAGSLAGPETVVVALVNDGGAEDGPTRLNASATTGIVA